MFSSRFILAALMSFVALAKAKSYISPDDPNISCGTTGNANVDDCNALLIDGTQDDVWNTVLSDYHGCKVPMAGSGGDDQRRAKRLACNGKCCVFVIGNTGDIHPDNHDSQSDRWADSYTDDIRVRAGKIVTACSTGGKSKVNGLSNYLSDVPGSAVGVCVTNENGCDDCFSGKDLNSAALGQTGRIL